MKEQHLQCGVEASLDRASGDTNHRFTMETWNFVNALSIFYPTETMGIEQAINTALVLSVTEKMSPIMHHRDKYIPGLKL